MKILSCKLVFLYVLLPFVTSQNQSSNSSTSIDTEGTTTTTTENPIFRGLFKITFSDIPRTPPNKTYYGIVPNRIRGNQIRNFRFRHFHPVRSTSYTETTVEGTQIVYKIKDMYKALQNFKFMSVPKDKTPVLEFNITLPPHLLSEGKASKAVSPFIFRMTLPKLNTSLTRRNVSQCNRGFLKMKGVKVNMFENGDMMLLFRKIASQISKAFNMSSREARMSDPILVIGQRLGGMGFGRRVKPSTTPSTKIIYDLTGIPARVRTRANVTIPKITDSVINMADYTHLFENY